jgi:hypothetical protein
MSHGSQFARYYRETYRHKILFSVIIIGRLWYIDQVISKNLSANPAVRTVRVYIVLYFVTLYAKVYILVLETVKSIK